MNRKLLIVVLLSTLLFSTSAVIITKLNHKPVKPESEISVSVLNVENKELKPTIDSYGTIQYKTKNDITSLQDGTVTEKKVTEGDFVKEGQILYVLKNPELEIQHLQFLNELNSSKAKIELCKAKLEEHRQNAKSSIINIENKKLELERLEKQLSIQESLLKTSKDLNKLGGITDQAVIDLENQITTLYTEKEILNHQLSISQLGFTRQDLINNNISPSEDNTEFQNQLIDLNTRTSLADLTVAETDYENAKHNVNLIEKIISNLTIRSPVTGIIGATYFEIGEHITKNEKVLTIMDISTCIASITLQESQINSITCGMDTELEIPAVNKKIYTTISDISPFTDPVTGTFSIKTKFENPDLQLKPGMFVKCSINTNSLQNYLSIPDSALIILENDTADCFTVQNNIAVKHTVKINFIKDGTAYIENGIKSGDKVINFPSRKIKDGTRVKVI